MDSRRRPDLLTLSSPAYPVVSSKSPATPISQSPFRYVQFTAEMTEKTTVHVEVPLGRVASSSRQPLTPLRSSRAPQTPTSPSFSRSRRRWILRRLQPWIPLIVYGLASLSFVVAIAFFRTSLFTFLDNLAIWLRADQRFGFAVLFVLIFITTFPPVPLYSTLQVLSGYTFGLVAGSVLSYFAALTGAVVVFAISRTLLRDCITRWLDSACTIKRVVRAVEKRPKLLFLVRLAPYPYNVMNCLLAASPTLTFNTYTLCTALSLFKVVVHTSIGASIRSFKDYHSAKATGDESANTVAQVSTIGGVILCIAIVVYLSFVARRAVDEELGDDEPANAEETAGFLANADEETGARPMVELRR